MAYGGGFGHPGQHGPPIVSQPQANDGEYQFSTKYEEVKWNSAVLSLNAVSPIQELARTTETFKAHFCDTAIYLKVHPSLFRVNPTPYKPHLKEHMFEKIFFPIF